jgi:hypothetical protein
MQLFGNEGKEDKSIIQVGNFEIKVMKASALLGDTTHPARFYPLSPNFHQGADHVSIVQYFHWLNKKPCICRRTSYDYTVPDTQNKPTIDTSCVICNDKFAWYAKAKEAGYKPNNKKNPPEAVRLHEIGKELNEKVSASSIVSLVDSNGSLMPPIILRYGKELLDQLQLHAVRILNSNGVHICDPAKGYMFDIIVGKNDGGFRTYKNSTPSVNMNPVDITGAPWRWDEICVAIQNEIKPIPSPEDVMNFYTTNYGGASSNQTFFHPAFQNTGQNNAEQGNVGTVQQFTSPPVEENKGYFVPPEVKNVQEVSKAPAFTPPNVKNTQEVSKVPAFTPPSIKNTQEVQKAPTFVPPGQTSPIEVVAEPVKVAASSNLLPCHGSQPNAFDPNATGSSNVAVNAGVKGPNTNSNGAFNTGDIQAKLDVLGKRIGNN